MTDLSLLNNNVSNFFHCDDFPPPVPEFMYVHTHHIQDNFVGQIEEKVLSTMQALSDKSGPQREAIAKRLETLAAHLGRELEEVSERTAKQILYILKEIYLVCNEVSPVIEPSLNSTE